MAKIATRVPNFVQMTKAEIASQISWAKFGENRFVPMFGGFAAVRTGEKSTMQGHLAWFLHPDADAVAGHFRGGSLLPLVVPEKGMSLDAPVVPPATALAAGNAIRAAKAARREELGITPRASAPAKTVDDMPAVAADSAATSPAKAASPAPKAGTANQKAYRALVREHGVAKASRLWAEAKAGLAQQTPVAPAAPAATTTLPVAPATAPIEVAKTSVAAQAASEERCLGKTAKELATELKGGDPKWVAEFVGSLPASDSFKIRTFRLLATGNC